MATKKSCGQQLLDNDLPTPDWDVRQLGDYAKRQHEAIRTAEQTLAPLYWRLGHALTLARSNFTRGQWGQFLASVGIDKTRSSKARAIYRAFSSFEAVESMSVEEAYQARSPRAQKKGAMGEQAVLPLKLGKALAKMEDLAMQVFDDLAGLTRAEKHELLKNLQDAITSLQTRAALLESQIDAGMGEAAGDRLGKAKR